MPRVPALTRDLEVCNRRAYVDVSLVGIRCALLGTASGSGSRNEIAGEICLHACQMLFRTLTSIG